MRLQREAPGFEINTFGAGGECLEHLKSGNADCILSDYQMPIMNGMQLLSLVRGMGHDVPFIFITGQGNEELAREAFKNGANDYFTKDIGFAHFTRIINSIEQAVRQRRLKTERISMEIAMRNIAAGVSAETGEGFFNSLVQYLARTLDVDFAFVGKLAKGDDHKIETISLFVKGAVVENFSYDLENTPCENVVGKELCSYPSDVQSLFPEDEMLVQMGIESYVGMPLFDSSGQPLGILVVLHSRPLANEGLIKSVLTIFATRASGELERNNLERQRADFISMVTSDIKPPLAAVTGSAELIAGGGRGEDDIREIALGIIKSGKKISGIVDNLLRISKL
jgi:CheY-like chemotaxis protein